MDKTILDKYELVVGLEIHAQLLTNSKIFSADHTTFGVEPNTNIGAVTLAHPGVLPKLNDRVFELAIRMGLACRSEITRHNYFDRKNYFYPDLPKGYQITQDKTPICKGGKINISLKNGEKRTIRLHHIHLEEDAGKSMHLQGTPMSFLDFNRAGMPLIEMVTEPDIRQAEEAAAVLAEVRKIVRYLDICDGNMEEGSMRCDVNISVCLKGAKEFGQRVEIKNLNSMRYVQKAIEYEFVRQITAVEKGEKIVMQTRLFDPQTGKTEAMRTKESLTDYRYFPDPDLPPFVVSDAYLAKVKNAMPALPSEILQKLQTQYQLPEYDAGVLSDSKELAQYFELTCSFTKTYKTVSNLMMGAVKSYLNENNVEIKSFSLKPERLAEIAELVESGKVSFSVASKELFLAVLENTERDVLELAENQGLILQDSGDSLKPLLEAIITKYPDKVKAFQKGNKNLLGLFMGEVLKASAVKLDPKKTSELISQYLQEAKV